MRAWRDSRCKSWKKLFSRLAELGLFWGDEPESSSVVSPSCSRVGLVLGENNSCVVERLGVFWACFGDVSISLVLSGPLLAKGALSSSKCCLIFSLSTHEDVQTRTNENNLREGRKQTIYHIYGSQDPKSLVLNSKFLHTLIHSDTWTPFPFFVEYFLRGFPVWPTLIWWYSERFRAPRHNGSIQRACMWITN